MPRYSEQFKRDAVALYENNEDLSLHAASAELGVNRSSLFSWLQQYGTGKRARTKTMRDKAQATTDSERIRQGPDPRKVDTSGVSYAAWVSVADVSASKVSGARSLHQECRLRVL